MATVAVPSRYLATVMRPAQLARNGLHDVGQAIAFLAQTIYLLPISVRKYRRQIVKEVNNLAWGRGAVIVDGGVLSVLLILGVAVGASVAIEAYGILNLIGFGALSGVIGGLANVREMVPIVAGIAFAAQIGCRITAEVGSMRISEEIDAADAMGIRPIPFVVGTRLIAGLLCVVPGYALTLVASFTVSDLMIRRFRNEPGGTYRHYFIQFLSVSDLSYSVGKAAIFCVAVIVIHCYYGYFASGGPVGVGVASGRAVRASLVAIISLDFLLTVALWGVKPTFVFTG